MPPGSASALITDHTIPEERGLATGIFYALLFGGDCCRGTDNRLGRKSSRNRDRSGINPRYYGPGFGNNSGSVEAYLVCRTTTPMLQFSVKG